MRTYEDLMAQFMEISNALTEEDIDNWAKSYKERFAQEMEVIDEGKIVVDCLSGIEANGIYRDASTQIINSKYSDSFLFREEINQAA